MRVFPGLLVSLLIVAACGKATPMGAGDDDGTDGGAGGDGGMGDGGVDPDALTGTGCTTPGFSVPWPTTGDSPSGTAVADFNGDARPDLVSVNTSDNTVSVMLASGDGVFRAKNDYATYSSPVAVAIADFNGDMKPDLAVANSGGGYVSILLGNDDGTFQAKRDTS